MAKHLKVKIDSLEFNWEIILKDINLTLNKNDRISIVWSNWAWKTTLLKILTWEITNYNGSIDNVWNMTLWYLHQIYSDNEEKLVKDELKGAFNDIISMEKQLDEAENKMNSEPENIEYIEEYTSLIEQFNNIWWHDYNNKIHQVTSWIWILDLLNKKLSEVSWWQRTKIALAKVLLQSPDMLFLDEPTNFIDMWSVEWLESFLQNKWKWWYVIISHDREFLDKTCSKTYEVQPWRWITYYHTNYSNYLIERKKIEEKKLENYKREQEHIEKEEKLINRFRAWSRAWWAKSRERSLEKMIKLESPYIPKKPNFIFDFSWDLPEKVLYFKEVFIWRKEPLFFISEQHLYKKQIIWIVWENWVWKSTFLKTIIWQIDVLDWLFTKWKAVKIWYYSQMHEELDRDKTVRDNFLNHWFWFPDQQLISILSRYLFDKTILDKKVSELSWWQTSKLLFAILWQKECNLLILDEPTNHLDYDTREALEEELKSFKWSILFISHDRYFVNKLATNIWFINDWELSVSYWNYEDYKFKLEHNIEMDVNVFDEEAELNIVLEEKIWERQFKKLKDKFSGKFKKRDRWR